MSFPFVALLVLALVVVVALAMAKRGGTGNSEIKRKAVLTANEQPMYFRLTEALPEHVVLAQVSFSALLKTRLQKTRNTFDRKTADFVICDKAFNVLAVVELDDSSHKGREQADAARDRLLSNAGLKVIRYKRVPNIETVRKDIAATTAAPAPVNEPELSS
jgi:very-short-patch-repair endonuclease